MRNIQFYLGMACGILVTAVVAVTSCGSTPQDKNQDDSMQLQLQNYMLRDSMDLSQAQSDSAQRAASQITWEEGACLVANYIRDPATCLVAEPYGTTSERNELMAFHVPRHELNYYIGKSTESGEKNLNGIRFYLAKNKKNGVDYHTVVMVGTRFTGQYDNTVNPIEPLYNDVQTEFVFDFCQPCPRFCHGLTEAVQPPRYGENATNCASSLANPRAE
jgi:hypothetical protein